MFELVSNSMLFNVNMGLQSIAFKKDIYLLFSQLLFSFCHSSVGRCTSLLLYFDNLLLPDFRTVDGRLEVLACCAEVDHVKRLQV